MLLACRTFSCALRDPLPQFSSDYWWTLDTNNVLTALYFVLAPDTVPLSIAEEVRGNAVRIRTLDVVLRADHVFTST